MSGAELGSMRGTRSRSLPTNHDHASLPSLRATREYQRDSPSVKSAVPGSGLSREGPTYGNFTDEEIPLSSAVLTGSFISFTPADVEPDPLFRTP
jgi:hypothetical protein